MDKMNIEIKARTDSFDHIREELRRRRSRFQGQDHQVDTYFNIPQGRLKLREGNIENALIFYEREDREGPKHSGVTLCKMEPRTDIKDVLSRSLGIKTVVDKQREIYYLANVKVHLDQVRGLGEFIEIEAGREMGESLEKLKGQVEELMEAFGVKEEDLLSGSYCDMVKKL